jgi:hypothetical protein
MDQKSQLCVTRINASFLPTANRVDQTWRNSSWLLKEVHETCFFSSSVILIVQEMRCICLHHALSGVLFFCILCDPTDCMK